MTRIRGFPPIAAPGARVLILGSMPSSASLAAGQYYAHAQNLFWHALAQVTGVAAHAPYARRARALQRSGIALWDVLASCRREGSLDTAIVESSIRANDFGAFFRAHRRIAQVLFNGSKAEAAYRRHVLPQLADGLAPTIYSRLPSTSPAHASLPRAQKLRIWREALQRALAGD